MTRRLDIAPDGTAEVLLLTNPIPRHVSLVQWGANDAPTTSWKSAADMERVLTTLREPPPKDVMDAAKMDVTKLRGFVSGTMDAWLAAVQSAALDQPISAADRSARVRALTVQAGARVATVAAALGAFVQRAAQAYVPARLELPAPNSVATVDGEITRRRLSADLENMAAVITDRAMIAMSSETAVTEQILSVFSAAADVLCAVMSRIPDGVVGVPRTADVTQRRGARNSQADAKRLKDIIQLAKDALGEIEEPPPTPEKKTMDPKDLKIALKALADTDPAAVLEVLDAAFKAAKAQGLQVTKRFAWGDTGEISVNPDEIMAAISRATDGTAILNLIAQAVGSIDITGAPSGTPAVTLRDAIVTQVAASVESNPVLGLAIKTLVAKSVGQAIAESLKSAGAFPENADGGFEADLPTDEPISLAPDLPGVLRS